MSAAYDVVIVGARCAGASLATHLARAGAKVAVLDAAALPSDQPLSTHLIQPPGMDELDALGVGESVRALSPPIAAARFAFDGREMRLRYGQGRAAHCLRRDALDRLLQEAAAGAGADLQPQSRVTALVRDGDGRVRGVEVRRRGGSIERVGARLVVGADGVHSAVARLAGANEYLGYDGPRASYWAYWQRPASWDPATLYSGFHGRQSHVLFPTNDDQVLIATSPPLSHVRDWHGRHDAAYTDDVRTCAPLRDLLEGQRPVSRVRVLARARYFFRAAAGPGWALAGDAGHHKEFVIGLGITDALRDGRNLADAIVEGGDVALQRYWRARDAARIEIYRWGQEMGRTDRVTALERLVAERIHEAPDMATRFAAVLDGTIRPHDLFPPARVLPWVLHALSRGDPRPLPPLIVALARTTGSRLEREFRRRLLARAARGADRPALADPQPRWLQA